MLECIFDPKKNKTRINSLQFHSANYYNSRKSVEGIRFEKGFIQLMKGFECLGHLSSV